MISLVLLLGATFFAPSSASDCERLSTLRIGAGSVVSAQMVEAGGLLPGSKMTERAAICRVAATLKPTGDSEIKIEVWMPEGTAWNGKYEATGNGGWGGSLNYGDMAEAVRRGYATSSTDTGHSGAGASFVTGHEEKLIDFGYRAVHEMTVAAKAVMEAYYGKKPKLSYFAGCSSGGRQGLMEAQRYPDDYDGVIAGAPTNNWTRLMAGRIWVAQATLSDKASYVAPSQYGMIHRAVLEACDALDGVRDGVLEDPRHCHFNPAELACKDDAAGPECLTQAQVKAVQRIYTPATNPRTGEIVFPAMERGSEMQWQTLAGGPKPISLADEFFKYVVFGDAAWDFRRLNFDSDMIRAEKRDGSVLSAMNFDLRPFFAHGGKLIQYHGWTDKQVMPQSSIKYYEGVKAVVGEGAIGKEYRLFMAPGMDHCGGGDGPDHFDMLTALENWREEGRAPDAITASHLVDKKVKTTRPLCAYPEVSVYSGKGSTDDASNFTCGSGAQAHTSRR